MQRFDGRTPDLKPTTHSLAATIAQFRDSLGLQTLPFQDAIEDAKGGRLPVPARDNAAVTKQMLYAYYNLLIPYVWNRFNDWRESQKSREDKSNPAGLITCKGQPSQLLNAKFLSHTDSSSAFQLSRDLSNEHYKAAFLKPMPTEEWTQISSAEAAQKKQSIFNALVITFRAHVMLWEHEHKTGDKQLDPNVLNLFNNCNAWLDHETRITLTALNKNSSLPIHKSKFRPLLQEQINTSRQGMRLTMGLGDAFNVALGVWDNLSDRPELVTALATTHSDVDAPLLPHIMTALGPADAEVSSSVALSQAVNRFVPQVPQIRTLLNLRKQEGDVGCWPVSCGCPALGTPAFLGSRDVLNELKRLSGGW
jgi:hypothetical protein